MNNVSALIWEGPLTKQAVARQLTKALFGSMIQPALPEEALRAEVLRVAIWEQCVLDQQRPLAGTGVSTQKVLRRARFLWEPLSPDFKKEDLSDEALVGNRLSRRVLESLAEQGDLLSLPGGQWLPSPLRLVPISSKRYLLVGGVPGSLLASSIFQQLHLHGSFRQLDAGLIQRCPPFDGSSESWQFQTRESWLGAPPLSFKALLQQFREIELLQQTTQYTAEVYVASLDKPQRQRWQSLDKVQEDGRYLLRSQKPWGQRFYTIGYIENRRIRKQSHILESWDIRRLCYALDDEAGRPTRAIWNKRKGILTLESELPARERKHLAILGILQTNCTRHYYPRIWRILPHYECSVQNILDKLSIEVYSL
jgi:hypothetical protein